MADYHTVDPKDQHLSAEGVTDHSDLTTFYAEAKKEVLGPWMQEDERQAVMQKERDKIQIGLRKSVVLIGLSISIPVILGILVGQLVMVNLQTGGVSNGGPIIFIVFLLIPTVTVTTILLLKWVSTRFQKHSLRALPITLTTLLSLFLVLQKIFDLFDYLIGGLVGYSVALAATVLISILISTVTIFIWTKPRLSGLIKLAVLLGFVGVAAAVFYLA